MKLARGSTLVIASHNKGKVREIRELLEPFALTIKGAAELGLPEPEETGATFVDNAVLKARAAADASGEAALADDSGLAVAALGGAPGIYSARWAGDARDFSRAMARVERELAAKNAGDRSAKFVCVLALAKPGSEMAIFEGEVEGTLVFPPRGDKGFGYDPIFVADGMRETFGEIAPATKHGMSHRARAFKKLIASGILTTRT
jgi:XTP/dITP diphosphohydrolase